MTFFLYLPAEVIIAGFFVFIVFINTGIGFAQQPAKRPRYAGSVSCRECHETFYQLWSTSFHGLAMQPYSPELAKAKLTPQEKEIVVGKYKYHADVSGKAGYVVEKGLTEKKKYKIEHVLGGKNVYCFLTPLERGRLQTLPVAYDVVKKEWFDTAASGIRHVPGEHPDEPVNWKEWPYTFNTACYSCHVSQLSTNYDLKTDTYKTLWAEPGINCETCHGPAEEHNKIARALPKGQPLPEPKIISAKAMTKAQRNDLCLSCHGKGRPLTPEYRPEERLFDHLDLVTLEDPDYYPDGRDLGENYTCTSWMMSPCARSGKLDCMHCHTSSGRYRFREEAKTNDACMPCHEERVKNASSHTHHKTESPGNKCVSCHMPMTSFARMNTSDHSMLPPTPAATIKFQSPNACNLCHKDKDAQWADKCVRQWRKRDYQAAVLDRASLIDAARKRDWSGLPQMLEYVQQKNRDEIFTVSLIRLLMASPDERKIPVLLDALKDSSPLIRAAAAESLGLMRSKETPTALLKAVSDESRLVRIRAAAALAEYPRDLPSAEETQQLNRVNEELLASYLARPDQWASHYNLGNYYLNRGDLGAALSSYETALKLEPRAVQVMVNASIAYAQKDENGKADESLRRALKIAPDNAAANFNLGLLRAEQGNLKEAEYYLRKALEADPQMAQAAYNLGIILARDRLGEAVQFCRKAAEFRPDEPKYVYTLVFYLHQVGETEEAVQTLKALVQKFPEYRDARMLLQEISNRKH